MKIAFVSEHASPLATVGGSDCGGQNVHVAELARALAAQGHQVTVYTRRDGSSLRDRVRMCRGVTVVQVPAGPAKVLPKDKLLPYMSAFGRCLAAHWVRDTPDVVHAHFWMSGLAALDGAREHGVPVVQTFHALGVAWPPAGRAGGPRSIPSTGPGAPSPGSGPDWARRSLASRPDRRQLPDPDGALVRYVALMSLSPCSRAPSASRSRSTLVSGAST